jgi:5'-phosphate synthase pdxT subunit
MKIGVIALQGAFIEHVRVIENLGAEAIEVRLPQNLAGIEGIIIPGGESTTILKLMHSYHLFAPLKKLIQNGLPIWGVCAGMICLAKQVSNSQQSILKPLEMMDIKVRRNAFGRQVDSFEVDIVVKPLGTKPFHSIFIRAPQIDKVGEEVETLATLEDGTVVAAKQNQILVSSFHPELTDDPRFHKYFLDLVLKSRPK